MRASVKAKATFKAISVREIRCGQRAARAEGFSRGHGFVESDLINTELKSWSGFKPDVEVLELNQSRVEVVEFALEAVVTMEHCEGIRDCDECDCLAGQHLELKATAVVDVQVTVAKAAVESNTDWLESMLRLVTGLVGS